MKDIRYTVVCVPPAALAGKASLTLELMTQHFMKIPLKEDTDMNGDNIKSNILREYTTFLKETSWYKHAHEDNAAELNYLTLGLVGVTGEFTDVFKKIVRLTGMFDPDGFQNELSQFETHEAAVKELGDVLWYLTRIADFLGCTLEDLMVSNTFKLYNRMKLKPHAELGRVEWPFTDPNLSYESYAEAKDFERESS